MKNSNEKLNIESLIAPLITRNFSQLKEEGFVMIYDDREAGWFKQFLDYTEYPYYHDANRNEHAPQRNRFEKTER